MSRVDDLRRRGVPITSGDLAAAEDTQQGAGDDPSDSGGDAAVSGVGSGDLNAGRTGGEPAPTSAAKSPAKSSGRAKPTRRRSDS